MPKIKDLGISAIPFKRAAEVEQAGYWMCSPTDMCSINPDPCQPTPPQCHPTNQPCNPTPPGCDPTRPGCDQTAPGCQPTQPGKKNASGLPHDAVIALRQQLHQQISTHLHG